MKLSIVVPCYDEAENIPLILKRFGEVIKRDDIEVILVDNKSGERGEHDADWCEKQYSANGKKGNPL